MFQMIARSVEAASSAMLRPNFGGDFRGANSDLSVRSFPLGVPRWRTCRTRPNAPALPGNVPVPTGCRPETVVTGSQRDPGAIPTTLPYDSPTVDKRSMGTGNLSDLSLLMRDSRAGRLPPSE